MAKDKKKSKKAASPFEKTLHFNFRNETKGAVRYDEVDDDGNVVDKDSDGKIVGSLYIRKSALDGDAPASLTVTIAED